MGGIISSGTPPVFEGSPSPLSKDIKILPVATFTVATITVLFAIATTIAVLATAPFLCTCVLIAGLGVFFVATTALTITFIVTNAKEKNSKRVVDKPEAEAEAESKVDKPEAESKVDKPEAEAEAEAEAESKVDKPEAEAEAEADEAQRLEQGLTQKRRTPPLSRFDTCKVNPSGELVSVYPCCHFINDKEIIRKLPIKRLEKKDNGSIEVVFTRNNRPILLQQGQRGCTAAVSAMLILAHEKEPDWTEVKKRNLGNTDTMLADITTAGLKGVTKNPKTLEQLAECIRDGGSSIVSVDSPTIQGHVVVVDEISKDLSTILLREPYHGWEITISTATFSSIWTKGAIIQVVKDPTGITPQ